MTKEKSISQLIREHNKKVSQGAVKWVNAHKKKLGDKESKKYHTSYITKYHDQCDYFK